MNFTRLQKAVIGMALFMPLAFALLLTLVRMIQREVIDYLLPQLPDIASWGISLLIFIVGTHGLSLMIGNRNG